MQKWKYCPVGTSTITIMIFGPWYPITKNSNSNKNNSDDDDDEYDVDVDDVDNDGIT